MNRGGYRGRGRGRGRRYNRRNRNRGGRGRGRGSTPLPQPRVDDTPALAPVDVEQQARLLREAELQKQEERLRQQKEAELAKVRAAEEAKRQAALEREKEEAEREAARLQAEEEARQQQVAAEEAAKQARILVQRRTERRLKNHHAPQHRPKEGDLRKLGANLKKAQAMMRKLGNVNTAAEEALIRDLEKINLTRYLEEMVNAVVGQKLRKASDYDAMVNVCSKIHQMYPSFSQDVSQTLVKLLTTAIKGSEEGKETSADQPSPRNWFRLLLELTMARVTADGGRYAFGVVKQLCESDSSLGNAISEQNAQRATEYMSLLTQCVKTAGEEMLGLPRQHGGEASSIRAASALVTEEGVAPLREAARDAMVHLIQSCFDRGVQRLMEGVGRLRAKAKANRRSLFARGELSEARQTDYEKAETEINKMNEALVAFGEFIGREVPPWPEEEEDESGDEGDGIHIFRPEDKEEKEGGPFPDEESRTFYQDLPNLRDLLPPVVFARDKPPKEAENTVHREPPVSIMVQFEGLISRLPDACNPTMADRAAMDFCLVNNKTTRKRLIKFFVDMDTAALPNLPYYARIVAVLGTVFDTIPTQVVEGVEDVYRRLTNARHMTQIDVRVRSAHFLGELVKFGVCPPGTVLKLIRKTLTNLKPRSMEAVCALFESCGRFLYATPVTYQRTSELLETMLRLRKAKGITGHVATMIENAYYACRPPDTAARHKKERPPWQLYMRQLLFANLNNTTVKYVLQQLRAFSWDEECQLCFIKCCLNPKHMKFDNCHLMATVWGGLSVYHPHTMRLAVDMCLEAVRSALLSPDWRQVQGKIILSRLVAELFNYQLLSSDTIIKMLYMMIALGNEDGRGSEVDPREDTSRLRMVCTVLDTCGRYFSKGRPMQKLDIFLLYMQRYAHTKSFVSVDTKHMLYNMLSTLRPAMEPFPTLASACQAVAKVEESKGFPRNFYTPHSCAIGGSTPKVEEEEDVVEEEEEDREEDAKLEEEIWNIQEELDRLAAEAREERGEQVDSEEEDEGSEDNYYGSEDEEYERTVEDEEIDRELAALTTIGDDVGKKARTVKITLAMPQNMLQRAKALDGEEEEEEGAPKIRVLLKRGAKLAVKQLDVPSDSRLVARTGKIREKREEEHRDVKRFVLQYQEQDEAERLAEVRAQELPSMRGNQKERRQRARMRKRGRARGRGRFV